MSGKVKLKRKHIVIVKTIVEKGKYKPTYSDQEPATKTLIKLGLVEWKSDYSGVVLTDLGEKCKYEILSFAND
jgi:hypothetical protein